jgi:hypothetical protein
MIRSNGSAATASWAGAELAEFAGAKPTLQRGQSWLCIHLVLAPFAWVARTTTAKFDRPHPART